MIAVQHFATLLIVTSSKLVGPGSSLREAQRWQRAIDQSGTFDDSSKAVPYNFAHLLSFTVSTAVSCSSVPGGLPIQPSATSGLIKMQRSTQLLRSFTARAASATGRTPIRSVSSPLRGSVQPTWPSSRIVAPSPSLDRRWNSTNAPAVGGDSALAIEPRL